MQGIFITKLGFFLSTRMLFSKEASEEGFEIPVRDINLSSVLDIIRYHYTLCTISVLRGINKSLQRLPRYAELWEEQGVCRILQSWGHFFLGP